MFYAALFIFGLIIGSFLNAVIYRLESRESLIKTRSHCPKCGHVLAWYELIPLVSFVIQRRRCRACRGTISWQYPAVELATGVLFVLMTKFQFPMTNQAPSSNDQAMAFYFLAIASLLIVIFVYDLKHYLIPDKIMYPAIAFAAIFRALEPSDYRPFLAAVASAAFFAAVFFVSKGKWLGFGDVKLVFFMGLFLGWPSILPALFFAFISGGIIGIGLIALGKKTLKSQVPFGPFLVAGTFFAMFWGEKIANWYFRFFL